MTASVPCCAGVFRLRRIRRGRCATNGNNNQSCVKGPRSALERLKCTLFVSDLAIDTTAHALDKDLHVEWPNRWLWLGTCNLMRSSLKLKAYK